MTPFTTNVCSRCGGTGRIGTYNPSRFDDIRAHRPAILEVPCPTCGARMEGEVSAWRCPICHTERELDREKHVERLTDDYSYPAGSGKPGMLFGECPVCGDEMGVNGGPDGELVCGECGIFHASRFSSEWFAYSEWQTGGPAVVNGNAVPSEFEIDEPSNEVKS